MLPLRFEFQLTCPALVRKGEPQMIVTRAAQENNAYGDLSDCRISAEQLFPVPSC